MPIQKFNVYDIIVDIFPGIIAIILFIGVSFPIQSISEIYYSNLGIPAGVVLVAIGYVVGRIIHGIASIFDSILRWLVRNVHGLLSQIKIYVRIHSYIVSIIGIHYSFTEHLEYALSPFSPYTVQSAISYEMITRFIDEYDIDEEQLDELNYRELEHFGHSQVYGENLLYRKYEILTTFFRSLYLVFFTYLLAFAYTGFDSIIYLKPKEVQEASTIWLWIVQSYPVYSRFLLIFLITSSCILFYQRRKFSNRRARALINDMFLHLNK